MPDVDRSVIHYIIRKFAMSVERSNVFVDRKFKVNHGTG